MNVSYSWKKAQPKTNYWTIIGTVIGGLALFFIYLYFFTGLAMILN